MYRRVRVLTVVFVVLTCACRALGLSESNKTSDAVQTLQEQQQQQQAIKAERVREEGQPHERVYSFNVKDPLMMGNVFRIAFEVSNFSSSEPRVSVDFAVDERNLPLRFELFYNLSKVRTNTRINGDWDLTPPEPYVRDFAKIFAPGQKIHLDIHVIDQFTYLINLNNDGSFILHRSKGKGIAAASEVRSIDVIAWDAHVDVDSEKVLLVNCKGRGV